jgi:hypothetical protein
VRLRAKKIIVGLLVVEETELRAFEKEECIIGLFEYFRESKSGKKRAERVALCKAIMLYDVSVVGGVNVKKAFLETTDHLT